METPHNLASSTHSPTPPSALDSAPENLAAQSLPLAASPLAASRNVVQNTAHNNERTPLFSDDSSREPHGEPLLEANAEAPEANAEPLRHAPPPVQFSDVRAPYAPLDATRFPPILPSLEDAVSPLLVAAPLASPNVAPLSSLFVAPQLPSQVTPTQTAPPQANIEYSNIAQANIAQTNVSPLKPSANTVRPVGLGVLNSFLLGGLLSCTLVGLGYVLGRDSTDRVLDVERNGALVGARENTVISAVKAVGPAVMNVDTTFGGSTGTKEFLPNPNEMGKPQQGKGTGVVIDSKRGLMLTNAHVVAGARKIQVTTRDGKKYEGRVIGFERQNDIAVVELSSKTLPEAKLAALKNSRDFQIGETAIAIGNPFAQANTVTVGVVSATGRTIPVPDNEGGAAFKLTEMIQTDAAINPGNSGGPLCNSKGEVIGINTAIFGIGTGLGFAIPINKAKAVAERIVKKGRAPVVKPVGFEMRAITQATKDELGLKDKSGALVQSVAPGSPPDKAGLQAGDVVQRVDGKATSTREAISKALSAKKAGQNARVEVLRNGSKQTLTWKIGK